MSPSASRQAVNIFDTKMYTDILMQIFKINVFVVYAQYVPTNTTV